MGTKYSQFPASSEINPSDVLVGLHNDGNSRFSFSTILVWIRQSVASFFVPTSRTVNNKALSQDISLGAEDVPYDNAHSSLTANNVQNAIDELAAGAGGGGVDPETIAPVEESATATVVHPLGSIFYFNDILYRAIEDIPVGGTINTATGGNATQTTIAQNFKRTVTLTSAEYAQLSIAEKTADIVYIITDDNSIRANDVNYDHETSGASATNVQDALDEVFSELGGKQPTITANGILKGDGAGGVTAATAGTDYQAPLTIDATPTANSTNPVQSGGVYTDVRTRVPVYGKGVNLLRNWYFVGGGTGRGVFPVNQRGQSSYNGFVYSIDNWQLENRWGQAMTINSDGVQIIGTSSAYQGIQQYIDPSLFNGQKVTISALCTDGTLATASGIITITSADRLILNSGGDLSVFLYGSTSLLGFHIRCLAGITKTIVAVKLELGTEQTLCHNEGTDANPVWVLNEVPDYEYELYRCMTSTADPSDTYANKSLATEQQLAYIESGTTASRAYSVGEYFCWNGLLYRAKTAISNGGTFTPGTNCEQVTDGGLNKIRSTDIPDEINSRFGYLRCVSKVNNTNSGATLTFDLNGNGVGIMFVQAAGTEGAIYGLTVLDSVAATRLVGSYSPTMNGANPRSFSINVGPWANVTIICTRSGWTA